MTMAEGTYEYECMRAELLGMPRPDESEWLEKQKERLEHEQEEIEEKCIEGLEHENEELQGASGKLDELNNILSITQKKLNRFKIVCGSLTNLLKIKVGQGDSSTESISKESEEKSSDDNGEIENNAESAEAEQAKPEAVAVQNGARKMDMGKTIDKQVDKLDAMIQKAENAQYSMQQQSKQMRSFLK